MADINVYQTVTSVSFEVEPNTNVININKVTTSGYSGVPNLQDVTDVGASTTNPITANSFIKSGGTGANVLLDNGTTTPLTSIVGTTNLTYTSGVSNGVVNSNTGTDATIPLADGINAGLFSATEKTKLSGIASGAEVNVNADWNAVSGDAQILNKPIIPSIAGLATTTYVDNKDNSQQLQLNYLDRDNSIFDAFYLRTIADGGTVEASNQLLSSLAVLRNISYVNQGYTQQINADKFVKLGGAADEYLMADGSVSFGGGGGGGATNLTTTQTISNFTINSNTGTDATVPLGNGSLAGATLNDYTTAEKNKLAGIQAGANLGVPYTGATSDVNLGEFGIQLGNLEFDNTPTNTPTTAGSMYYNDADGTLDLILKGGNVTLQVGQETVIRVVNKTSTSISLLQGNYQAVRITGAQGQRPKVDLAQATNDVLSAETIGLVTETIANNQEGFITTSGLVRGINTTGSIQGETWVDGDIIYLSPTVAGSLTKVKPVAPNHLIIIGYVISAHITQGTIFVKVDNGYELDELHNVKINGVANNNVLAYTLATDIWENKTVETALGFIPANDASVVHLTSDETIDGDKTFIGAIAVSGLNTGFSGSSYDGTAISGYSENGLAGYFDNGNSGNIVNFNSLGVLKAAVQSNGKITATAGTASTDVVVKSQLDAKVVQTITNGVTTTAPSENAVFDALALKADLASPTFTGTVTLPKTTTINTYSPIVNIVKDVVPTTPITGTLTETIFNSYLIPANTFSADDMMKIPYFELAYTGTTIKFVRIFISTSNTLTGAVPISLLQTTTALYLKMSRQFTINNGLLTGFSFANPNTVSDINSQTFSTSSTSFNPTVDNYIITTGRLGLITDSIKQRGFCVTN